ncbi:MAG: carboxy terminal-processing peptidase [Puniceicoccales bacterium]|nr:carboxy terminal-processing peptidase [Puniceicoccales bacterium]
MASMVRWSLRRAASYILTFVSFGICFGGEPLRPTAQMPTETLYMMRCLSGLHYNRRPISTLSRDEILDAYLQDLDPQKLFFLQSDIDGIHSRYNLTLDIFLNSGSVKPAFVIYETFRARANEWMDYVESLLQNVPHFSEAEFYEPDRKNASWPTSTDELADLWRRRLRFEMLNEILQLASEENLRDEESADLVPEKVADGSSVTVDEGRLHSAQEALRKRFYHFRNSVNDVEPSLVQELFLNSVAGLYDPQSSFMSASTWEDFQSCALTNSLMGIGAVLQDDDGYCKIVEIYPGSPAARSGQLHIGDRILSVQQENEKAIDIMGMRLNRAVKLIRGPKGSVVTLCVQPAAGDPSDRKIVVLTRDEVQLTSQRARARIYDIPNGAGETIFLGYLKLPAFYGGKRDSGEGGSYDDVAALLHKLSDENVVGLVVDLRGNTGGLLDEAIGIAGLFLGGGPVVQVRDGEGNVQVFADPNPEILYRGPLVILTSKQSASASEILAGALQDHRRAVVVGDQSTYGKGSVQAILPISQAFPYWKSEPQLGAARITIQKWYRPRGESIQRKGVLADIALPSFNDSLPFGEGDNDHALAWDAVSIAPWNGWQSENSGLAYISDDIISVLRERSERRMDMPERKLLEERTKRFGAKMLQKKFSLGMEDRRRQRDEDRMYRKQLELCMKQLAESDYPFRDVHFDDSTAECELTQTSFENTSDDGLPEFDVPLREALHVLRDWISLR